MYPNISSSATVAVNNGILQRGELKAKAATKITEQTMQSLNGKLSNAFQDPVNQQILKGVGELTDIDEQLQILESHFLSGNFDEAAAKNDQQYAAINEIRSAQIHRLANKNNVDVMADIKGVVSHSNPHQLDHKGVLNFLTSLIAPSQKDTLSDQISEMMKEDPTFASMIDSIRSKPNTYTWVTLQLKDEVRHKLEKEFVEGKVTIEDAQKILADPEQRRIKSISIQEMATYTEGFTSPTPFIGGGSNASVYMDVVAGGIDFSYGRDQDKPRTYTISGDFASAKPDLADALKDLKESGGLTLA